MRSKYVERFVFLFFGFVPGVLVGALAVLLVAFFGGWITSGSVFMADIETPPPENQWLTEVTYGSSAVHLPVNQILLVQTDSVLGAIKFTNANVAAGTVQAIVWVLRPDGDSVVIESEQEFDLFEKYNIVEKTVVNGNVGHLVEDAGSQDQIPIGKLSIGWSASAWVYFQPGMRFALVPERYIDDVNIDRITPIQNMDQPD